MAPTGLTSGLPPWHTHLTIMLYLISAFLFLAVSFLLLSFFFFFKNHSGHSCHKVFLFSVVNNSCSFQEANGKPFICSQPRLLLKKQSVLPIKKNEKKEKKALESINMESC